LLKIAFDNKIQKEFIQGCMLDSPKKEPEKKPWNSGLDVFTKQINDDSSIEEFDYGILPDIGKKNVYLKL